MGHTNNNIWRYDNHIDLLGLPGKVRRYEKMLLAFGNPLTSHGGLVRWEIIYKREIFQQTMELIAEGLRILFRSGTFPWRIMGFGMVDCTAV